jgi:hypothetical protein
MFRVRTVRFRDLEAKLNEALDRGWVPVDVSHTPEGDLTTIVFREMAEKTSDEPFKEA